MADTDYIRIALAQREQYVVNFGGDPGAPHVPFFAVPITVGWWRGRMERARDASPFYDRNRRADDWREAAAVMEGFGRLIMSEALSPNSSVNPYGQRIFSSDGAKAYWSLFRRLALLMEGLDSRGIPNSEMTAALLEGAAEGWKGVKDVVGDAVSAAAGFAGETIGWAAEQTGRASAAAGAGFLSGIGPYVIIGGVIYLVVA